MKNALFAILLLLLFPLGMFAQPETMEIKKEINGVELYIKIVGEGKPLLIVNAGPGLSHDYFLPYLLPLAQKYKLIFYDQRSSGRSAIPADSMAANYTNMVEDIEGIRKAFGFNKINILAHSWGVIPVVNYALKYGDHVQSLVLSNALNLSHEFDYAQRLIIAERWKDSMMTVKSKEIKSRAVLVSDIRMRLDFLTAMYDINKVDSIKVRLATNYPDAQTALYRGLQSETEKYDRNYYPELKSIKAPSLVIHGDYDNIPLAASEKLKASLPKGTLVRFPLSGHFPFMEEPAKYVETVLAFLNTANR